MVIICKLFKKIFLFKQHWIDFNYSEIINKYNENILNKFYLSNNFAEFIHSKIILYLPKKTNNKYDSITLIENIIYSDTIKNYTKDRIDYKTYSNY